MGAPRFLQHPNVLVEINTGTPQITRLKIMYGRRLKHIQR